MTRVERKNWREIFRLESNSVVKALTISDIMILSGFGLLSPIFAIFINGDIKGGNVEAVGVATTIYLLTKSIGQLPAAQIIDKFRGERDDWWSMIIGSMATSLIPLLYILASKVSHIYIIQFFYGLAQAFTFPSWMAIFTRHIDKNKEGMEWGIYYTLTDLSGAGVAAIGGIIANYFGFKPVFLLVSILSFAGSGWLLLIKNEMKKR